MPRRKFADELRENVRDTKRTRIFKEERKNADRDRILKEKRETALQLKLKAADDLALKFVETIENVIGMPLTKLMVIASKAELNELRVWIRERDQVMGLSAYGFIDGTAKPDFVDEPMVESHRAFLDILSDHPSTVTNRVADSMAKRFGGVRTSLHIQSAIPFDGVVIFSWPEESD